MSVCLLYTTSACLQAAEVAIRCQEPVTAVLGQALQGHQREREMQLLAEEAAAEARDWD